ncbi:dipeptide ABC transporter ATP-binding protein [Pokkaliibacter sp. CJK22405]|uniref:ABC transporter ATP-binding protein n=1 Tax=Pokkaliibacter sp. CJK22405 TaxID=3384615 RepID=UPI003984DFE3
MNDSTAEQLTDVTPQADQALLEVRDLAVDFHLQSGPVHAVRSVSFSVMPGKTLAIVGESGSGKSVTAQAILGILPANANIRQGEIHFRHPKTRRQHDLAAESKKSRLMNGIRGQHISMIFQEPMVSLSSMHTLCDQIGEVLRLHRKAGKKEARAKTRDMLELVGFPDPDRALDMYPFELSGGLRQRAMIAMALICGPSLLIADEPTTALDVTIQTQILGLIKRLQAEMQMAVLLITHDLGVVANMADDVVVMYHGEVMESGPVRELFSSPEHAYLQALFNAIPHFDMHPGERLKSLRDITPDLGALQTQRRPWEPEQRSVAPHLQLKGLSKSYQTRRRKGWWQSEVQQIQAVNELDLSIRCGESFGLVGESGCGKTTLSKLIMGALTPDQGEILYNDRGKVIALHEMKGESMRDFRPKMQFIFQDPYGALNPRMTVLDILTEPLAIHQKGTSADRKARAQQLMKLVGLDPRFLGRYPHSFSGGQRQRIAIARALALEPDLLICDEPVSALDVSVQAQILNLLKDLHQELGLTYLFISHNLAVVDYIADRIGVMCNGRLVEVAPREMLFRDPVHPYTQTLLSAVPYADLERPLDFARLEDSYRDPRRWPAPFGVQPGEASALVEHSPGHWVRKTQEHAK